MDSERQWTNEPVRNGSINSRFHQWFHCICAVTFDLELGQAMEAIFPPTVRLSDREKANVCYSAFPDSNSGCMGDTQFHIRLRACEQIQNDSYLKSYNRTASTDLQAENAHLWGYVYFRQIKDVTLPRSYFQKSIVILSRLPFTNLYKEIVSVLAPRYFTYGDTVIDRFIEYVNHSWPDLKCTNELVELPIIENLKLDVMLPSPVTNNLTPNQRKDDESNANNSISLVDNDIVASLLPLIDSIHLLWELILLGEPIIVLATSPTQCCRVVTALIQIIRPLEYAGEFRPYFTIHDTEFKEFTQPVLPSSASLILGVTNPFFGKTLQHWPHIVRVNESGTGRVDTPFKNRLKRDKDFIRRIDMGIKSGSRPAEVQAALIRQHLMALTHSFMIPLERYVASLMPLAKSIMPLRMAPQPASFDAEAFLGTISQSGPQLTSQVRADWPSLYRHFLRTRNFSSWQQKRISELSAQIERTHCAEFCALDMHEWARGKHEIEIIDMILRCKQKLSKLSDLDAANMRARLERHLEELKRTLPEDISKLVPS